MVLPTMLKDKGLYNVQNSRNLFLHSTETGCPGQKDYIYIFMHFVSHVGNDQKNSLLAEDWPFLLHFPSHSLQDF